jgi:hypothetical protein
MAVVAGCGKHSRGDASHRASSAATAQGTPSGEAARTPSGEAAASHEGNHRSRPRSRDLQKREEGLPNMNRRRSLGLAPLLVSVAFAVMPAGAQAVPPHVFKNGVETEPGGPPDSPPLGSVGLDSISWGTLTLGNVTIGVLKCENIFSGDVKNPLGGGAGNGEVDGYVAYDCTGAGCEGAGGKFEVIPEGLNEGKHWTGVLVETPAGSGVIRLKIGNKEAASETKIRFEVVCLVNAIKLKFSGELSPKAINGTEIGIAPSKIEFDAGAGTLESATGPGEVGGKLKIMGYEGQELLTSGCSVFNACP